MKQKYPEFVEWGRAGGKARARKLTKKRRSAIARKAVRERERKRAAGNG